MLVLSRKVGEAIKLADDIEITVLAIDNLRVRLGIRAPRHINVRRTAPDETIVDANREAALDADQARVKNGILSKAASARKEKN
jgi:carbon storage regulator